MHLRMSAARPLLRLDYPVRVGNKAATKGNHVGLAFGKNGFSALRIDNALHPYYRDSYRCLDFCNFVDDRGMSLFGDRHHHRPDGWGNSPARRDVQGVHSSSFQRASDHYRLVHIDAASFAFGCDQSENDREVRPHRRSDFLYHFQDKAHPAGKITPVFVAALVEVRGVELLQ